MTCAIGIFAKTIGLSPVKTRLAQTIGKERAESFYRLSLQATAEIMSEVQRQSGDQIFPYWAVAEEHGPASGEWETFPAFWTGEGGLGSRLCQVADKLFESHDCVFVVGSDSPQLASAIFLEALSKLESDECDCVIGPSVDGGFYLFGSKNPVPREVWEAVTYSVSNTCRELIDHLCLLGWKVKLLEPQFDVDEADNLLDLKSSLNKQPSLIPAQNKLLDWLESI